MRDTQKKKKKTIEILEKTKDIGEEKIIISQQEKLSKDCVGNNFNSVYKTSLVTYNHCEMKDEDADTWEVRHGSTFVLALMGVFCSWLYYKTPSALEPTLWKNPFPLPKLTGPLTPNTYLQHVEKATCSKEGNCISPESLAIDQSTGDMYASLADGRIVKLDKTGSFLANVFFSGGYVADHTTNNGLSTGTAKLMTWCKNEALAHRLAWNTKGEKTCGRPLGIRLSGNTLFFVDAYHGLFSLDLKTLQTSHHVTPSTTIYPPKGEQTTSSTLDPVAFLPPKFFNDIDLTSDKIYFSDSSYLNTRSENRAEVCMFDHQPYPDLTPALLDKSSLLILTQQPTSNLILSFLLTGGGWCTSRSFV